MLISITKFIHLLFVVSFLGLQIGSYYYTVTSIKSGSQPLLYYTLKLNLWMDMVLLPILVGIYGSCAYLVGVLPDITYGTPWVMAACTLLTVVLLCFLCNMFIKYKNLRCLKQKVFTSFKLNKLMHVNFVMIIILLILITHDAVMRATFFSGLL